MSPSIDTAVYDTPVYRRSRWAYAIQCAFEYFVTILISGAFLAGLLSALGISDALIGVISSFVSLAFLFELLSLLVVGRLRSSKTFSVLIHALSRLLFAGLYLIPFLPIPSQMRQITAVLCVLLSYFCMYFANSILYKWCNSYVSPYRRAEYSAVKEMISLASGITVSLSAGWVIDAFVQAGQRERGFIFTAVAIAVFSLCDLICLLLVKDDRESRAVRGERTECSPSLREVLKGTLGNRNFRLMVLLAVLWRMAEYTTTGFLGTYQLNPHELAFSVGAIQLINLLGSAGRFLISRPFGRYSDRTSFARGMKVALLLAAMAYGINVFTTPSARYLLVGYVLLHGVAMAGLNANMVNITYSYVDEKYFVYASALKNSISGLCGFGASLVAGRILSAVQANGNTVLGISLYGQQLLSLISCGILLLAAAITHFVLEKERVLKQ